MKACIKRFTSDEQGAVTVDWVVLTAIAVGLVIGILNSMEDATETVTTGTGDAMIAFTQ